MVTTAATATATTVLTNRRSSDVFRHEARERHEGRLVDETYRHRVFRRLQHAGEVQDVIDLCHHYSPFIGAGRSWIILAGVGVMLARRE